MNVPSNISRPFSFENINHWIFLIKFITDIVPYFSIIKRKNEINFSNIDMPKNRKSIRVLFDKEMELGAFLFIKRYLVRNLFMQNWKGDIGKSNGQT